MPRKLNSEEVLALYSEVRKDMTRDKGLRFGQSVYNNSFELSPSLVRPLANTDKDPFYNCEKVKEFLNEICDTRAKDHIHTIMNLKQ